MSLWLLASPAGNKATSSLALVVALLAASLVLWDWRIFALALLLGLRWLGKPLFDAYYELNSPAPVSEQFFESGSDFKQQLPFPSLVMQQGGGGKREDENLIDLSVIVPAYREELRLGKMLDEAIAYLIQRKRANPAFTWEIIIVDDGSPDNTFKLALSYTDKYTSECVRVLKLVKNGGKGGAVRKGMLRARGKLLLMADADGATKFAEVEKLEAALKRVQEGMALGSRAHLKLADSRSSGLRGFVSQVFQTIFVSMLVPGGIRDTQCGFKLFTRRAAQQIFPLQKMNGWAFDCELLFLARRRFNLPAMEVAVDWTDVDGSTLSVADASLEMARDILLMYLLFTLRVW